MVNIEPPTVRINLGKRLVQIDTGELLFPGIALVFCVLYYWDTRGLPEQSLMYAEPLLYTTVILALITLFHHAVSITSHIEEGKNLPPDREKERRNETELSQSGQTDGGSVENTATESIEKQTEMATPDNQMGSREQLTDNESDLDVGNKEVDEFFNTNAAIRLGVVTLLYTGTLYLQIPFVASTVVFLAGVTYMFGERRPIRVITYSVGFTLIVWAVFIAWLNVPLP